LSGSSEQRWGEAVNALAEASQQLQALLTDEPSQVAESAEERGAPEQEQLAIAQQAYDFHRQNLTMAELHLDASWP
jgi:hypothetical protein